VGDAGPILILTNDGAQNFRLMAAPVANPGRAHWTEVVPERPGVRLNFTDVHIDHVVLGERSEGLQLLEVLDSVTGELHIVNPPKKAKLAYPLSTFSYVIAPKASGTSGPLKTFISYAVHAGQAFGAALDFAPLPKVVSKAAIASVGQL